jgi:hypothetical protein
MSNEAALSTPPFAQLVGRRAGRQLDYGLLYEHAPRRHAQLGAHEEAPTGREREEF